MKHDRLISALDAAAEHTGLPAMARGQVRRRHLRWLPIVALALSFGGWTISLANAGWGFAGQVLVYLGLAIAGFLPLFGPIKPWGTPERVDEFDRAARTRAFLVAFATMSAVALGGIWLLIAMAALGRWPLSTLIVELNALAVVLLTLYSAVPTLHASWATRPLAED
ncbi:hypothetical protein [Sphingomonas sp.]|uniref:hypothetical protein n=1 Tax=Sphingomonas sp. TaxID=28214 RepID=UPI001B1B4B65|nr:hypothetical protein [Sphingomonas sp.]MBO9714191.1 hypothetical protein [Sphingomonas sp.]